MRRVGTSPILSERRGFSCFALRVNALSIFSKYPTRMNSIRTYFAGALSALAVFFAAETSAQNIFNGEGVNFVGQINGYAQPTNLSADYRVLTYRRLSVTTGTPTDGRGQWTTTVNVQSSGGNVTPLNMTGGGGSGFLFTSGPSGNQYANKWAFGGVGQAALNAINGATYQGASDMGINMSTAGYYTFNMQDNGYASNSYFVGYTAAAPVTVTHTTASQQTLLFNGLRVGITTSATPSTGENVYVRYRTTTNDFSASTTVVQATGSGTAWNALIPMQAPSTAVFYYVFTSTRTLAQLQADSEFNRSMAAIRYVDNAGSNYSFTFPANPIIVSSSGGTASASYPSLTLAGGAFAAINAGTHTGTISIGINASVSTETGATALNASGTGSASYTSILITPNFTSTISGAGTTTLIALTGADNVTIDGRIGQTGTTKSLTISNTSTAATQGTITLQTDATSNIIRYCNILGVATATTAGVIYLGTGTTTGNDNNTIDNCDIRDGATTPVNGIFSAGSTASTALNNSGLTVSNCNIFNFYGTGSAAGIWANAGSTDWTVSGNSFYQTAARAGTTGSFMRAIYLNTGSNYLVSGNFIGGSAPLCGSTALTVNGTAASYRFVGIALGQSTTTASSVQGNTIANISWLSTSGATTAPGVFAGIYSTGNNANIGTVTGNVIGSGTGTGNIAVQANTTGAVTYGIVVTGTTVAISNNTIGSMTLTGATTSISHSFQGISSQGTTTLTITNNQIGSASTANSINASTASTNGTSQSVQGIEVLTSNTSFTITGNTIANMNNAYAGTAVTSALQTRGIYVAFGAGSISNNTIFNIVSASANLSTTTGAPMSGITMSSTTAGMTINQNTIHSLSLTAASASVTMYGLYYAGPTTGTNVVGRNFIHSLNLSSTSTGAQAIGMYVNGGTTTFQNNMIRLGLFSSGNSITNPNDIQGIQDASGTNNYYFNSIYIGGTGVTTGSTNTIAFNSLSTSTRVFQNNIFMNARSNSTGTGVHIAAKYAGTVVNPSGLTASNNVLFAPGTGGAVGQYNSTNYTTLSGFQAVTGQDANSINGNPNFLTPAGTSSTVDLHVNTAGTPVEQAGILVATITDDYDGQTRSGLTPTDIGADAGNFVAIDASAPSITYTALATPVCSSVGAITLTATITDASGVPTTGSLVPRLYYKVGAAAYTSVAGTLTAGSGTNGTWSFTIPAQTITAQTTILYYVIAQDIAGTPNIGSNPGGVVATNVNTVTTAPASPSSFVMNATMSGNYNVGAGQTFTTLTAAVAAYNSACLGGAVTFTLTDASYTTGETFPITINANSQSSSTNTLTIKPSLANTVISGTSTGAMIALNGADWVRLDGSISSTVNSICPLVTASRDLTITNNGTGANSAVVWLNTVGTTDPATNNIVRNCNIVGGSNSTTVAGIGIGSSTISNTSQATSNNNNRIENNNIQKANIGIYTSGASTSTATYNSGTVLSQNSINSTGTNAVGTWGIFATLESGITITGNTVGEIFASSDRAGINIGYGTSLSGTNTVGLAVLNPTISNNTVYNVTASGTFSAVGIAVGGVSGSTVTITNNVVYGINANPTSTDFCSGIAIGAVAGCTYNVYHNSVSMTGNQMAGGAGASVTAAFAVTGAGVPTLDMRNNNFSNTQIGNTSSTTRFVAVALGYSSTLGNYANLTSDYNNLYAAGAGPGTYHVGVTGGVSGTGVSRTSLANWQTETGRDANSFNVVPGFVSASNLHSTSTTLNNAGTPILSVTTDMDCETRSTTTPDIGADEYTVATDDAGVTAITTTACPGAGNTVTATIFNFGSATLTTVDVTWSVNGGATTTQTFTGLSIAGGASATVNITGVTFTNSLSAQSFTASTSLPNGNVDANSGNDSFTNSAINTSLSGTYTVGATGNFTTIAAALSRASTSGLCGPTVFSLIDATYTVSSTLSIGQYAGVSSTNTLTIKPATGVTAAITGASTVNPIIIFDGADYVTIDGSNGSTANAICPSATATRDLTVTSNSTATTASAVVWMQTATGSNGATNNTVMNCNIVGNSNTTTQFGVGSGSSSIGTSSLGTGNNNNSIVNNNISKVLHGIYSFGASAANRNTGTVIHKNVMSTSSPNNVAMSGINIGFENGASIRGNTISELAASTDLFGINVGYAVSSIITGNTGVNECINTVISENTIGNIVGTGTFSAVGIAHGASTSGTVTISNNMIYGVRSNATPADFSSGIVLGGGAGSTLNVYNNSVYMTGTITGGTAFSSTSACLSVTATTAPTLDIRNNLFVNDQVTNSGTAGRFVTIALGYSSTVGNYSGLTSNKNDLFVASGAAYHIGTTGGLGSGGTNRTTLSAWQTETGRDAASVNVMPVFTSSTNLRLNAASVANLSFENSADALASVTTDIDCDTRSATTPDMGVDEFTSTVTPYDIGVSDIVVPSPLCPGSTTIQATVTNYGALSVTGFDVNWSVNGVPQTTASFPAGTIATGGSTTVTLGTYTFSAGLTANSITATSVLAADAAAGNDAFTLGSLITSLSGTYTVGATGDFNTITSAVTAANTYGICGPTVFSLIDASYTATTETFPITINTLVGSSSTNTLTIKPTGTSSITGNNANGIFVINGADNIIINGSAGTTANTVCPPVSATRDLTITNNNTGSTAPVIWIQNATGNGATNNIVRNCNILGAGATNYGIGIGGPALASSGTDNDNNRIENNSVAGVQIGIYSQGASTGNKNTGNVISQNVMTGTSPNIGKWGILVGFEDGIQITANNIANVSGTTGDAAGISLGVLTIIRSYSGGNDVTGATVSGNRIHNIVAGSNQSPAGIALSAGAGSANNIINNMISGILYNGTSSTDMGSGLMLYGPTSSAVNIYHNNILLEGTTTSSEALNIGIVSGPNSNSLVRNIRNNILVTRVNNTGGGKSAGIGNGAGGAVASAFANATMNYNAFGVSGTNSGVVGYSGLSISGFTLFTTLAAWQAAGTFDANSVVSNTAFVSASDLHIDPIDVNNLYLNGTAVVISGITTDYDCDTRNATTPDIGADEYVAPDCTTVNGGTITAGTSAFCGSGSTTITSTGVTGPYAGITYIWESSPNGTTGWTSTGSTNPLTFTTPTLTTTTYYRLAVSCSISAQTAYSNVVAITVNAFPTAVISPTGAASICTGGSISLSVTTDIGTSYQWFNGASAIGGATSSTYSATTAGTYTVVVTGPGGCSTTSGAVVASVNPVPTAGAASVTPGTVCANGTVNLASSATGSGLYNVTPITYGVLSPTGTPTTIISSGDDAIPTTVVTLPFTFNFFGSGKTQMKVSSNGWVTFNTTTATSAPTVASIPDASTPGDVIYGLWDDLNVVSPTSLVRYFTNGTAPNRVFVVDYSNVKFYNNTASNGNTSFQIHLYETTNIVEIHVTEATDPVASNKTIGIENNTSTIAYTPTGRNLANFSVATSSPEAWRFAPDAITYSWTGPNSFTSTLQNPSITNVTTAAAGTYTATYTNVFGCSSSSTTAALVVNSKPTASISGSATICNGSSTNLTINVTGTGPFSGTLSNGATFSGAGPSFTVTVSPSTNTTYTVTALNDALCSAQAGDLTGSAVVTVNARPTAVISGSTALCAGNSATLTIAVTGTGTINGTLSNGASFSGTAPSISVTVTPSGTTTYTVATLSDTNCSSIAGDLTGSAVVTVNALPTGAISGTTAACAGTSANLTLAVTGTGVISGTLSDGSSFTGTAPSITVSVSPTTTTTYTIATLSDANCSALAGGLTGSATVTVNARPTGSISGTDNLCSGSSANLTLAVTGSGTISGTLSDGTTFSGTAPTITVSVSPTATTTYTIATLNDANCSALAGGLSGSATITVNPRPTGAISGTQTMCSNASANLTITVTGSGTISGTLSNGQSFSGTAPTITVTVTPTVTTTYTIATLSDANCTSIAADRTGSAVVTVTPAQTYFADIDGDGYSSGISLSACSPSTGYYLAGQLIATSGDCNDSNSDIYPTADEYCNGVDEDCDLAIDEGLIFFTYYQDNDGDGYGNPSVTVNACAPPAGYVLVSGDCLDSNAAANPAATEVCNGINDDCDGFLDEGCGPANDNKATAQLLTFNGQNNCNAISGTLFGAQPSTSGTYSVCVTGEDVWYYFTPTTTAARIACNTTANNVVMELQTQAGGLVEIENVNTGVGNEFLNVDNLTVGATYFIVIRNYDSGAAVGGNFNICVTAINHTACNYGPGPYSFCGSFKANFTSANQYVFNLFPQPSGTTIIGTSNTTLISLASIPGIQNGVTYNVRIDAVYNLLNGAGQTETIVVEGLAGSICSLIMAAQPSPPLRTSDACPNIRNRKSTIGLAEWVCGAGGFEWEFTETAPSPGLPMTYTENSPTRFLNLQNVTFLTAGSTYSVRVRPLYNNGSPSVFTNAGCLQLAAPALGALDETDPQFALRNEVEEVEANVYPNPNNGELVNIHYQGFTDEPVRVRIFDAMGRVVYTNQFVMEGTLNAQITFEKALTSGVYQIEFSEADRRLTERLVIQK